MESVAVTQARCSWVPMEPDTPTSRWMLARGTPALQSWSSWDAGSIPGTPSLSLRLVRMYPKIEAIPGVYVYGTVPATGKCQVLRSVPYSPFVEHPGWTGLDAQVLRGDTVAALDWINRNRVDLNKAKVGCTFGGR